MTIRKKAEPEISVWYYACDGHLYFVSEEKDENDIKGRYERCVPDDILSRGDDAVKQYTVSEIKKKRLATQKRINKRQKKMRETNFPLVVIHEGACLEGRIIGYNPKEGPGGVEILLEKPEEYKDKCRDAGGKYRGNFFNEKGDLTGGTIEDAGRTLVRMYERKKQEMKESEKRKSAPAAYEAAERLNKQRS